MAMLAPRAISTAGLSQQAKALFTNYFWFVIFF
jgi:hypothetical protein